MRKNWKIWVTAAGFMVLLISACSPGAEVFTGTLTSTAEDTLRPSPSGTATSTASPTVISSPTPNPTATPTPVYYEIQLGDDMYSIGWRFGISAQAIMTANPSVVPEAMIVGTELVIPVTLTPEPTESQQQQTEASPQPTQIGFMLSEPDCYLESLGGLWCFILVENDSDEAFENISAIVTLQQGDETRQKIAIMPLNLLPAGESLPLVVYFEPPVSPSYTVIAEVDFYLPVRADDDRYFDTTIEDLDIAISDDGRSAQVSGELRILAGQPDGAYAWVHATGYDNQGDVVAVRRWSLNETLQAEALQPFNLTLYSLAGEIERVELLVEAHRSFEETSE